MTCLNFRCQSSARSSPNPATWASLTFMYTLCACNLPCMCAEASLKYATFKTIKG